MAEPAVRARLFAPARTQRQEQKQQTPFKVAYYYDKLQAPTPEELNKLLRQQEITANVVVSFGQFLDVVLARLQGPGPALRRSASTFRWNTCWWPAGPAPTRI
ncbi:MAG: HAD family hydrolase [Halioglobus sp.]